MDRESVQERFGIIGTSPAIRQVIDRIRQVARTDITVLLEGESGVGKELVAHAIHEMSMRRHKSQLVVNCGAIPEGLLESELFGAEKGAYTGAVERRSGYFEEADGGTLFLDEIGEMPQAAQVRLLRVLETGQFSRIGSSAVLNSDVRIIAATNKDLGKEVEAGRFREDLYYRLSTVIIRIPPLRERRDDILPIFRMFLHRFTQKYNSPSRQLDHSATEFLTNYRWPGNVRELRNVAEQVVVLQRGDVVTADDIRPFTRGITAGGTSADLLPVAVGKAGDAGETRERELIYRALLELRMEVREMREEVKRLSGHAITVARPELDEQRRGSEFVVVRRGESRPDVIEDVVYEIENESDYRNGRGRSEDSEPLQGLLDLNGDDKPLPTIEDVEQQLIQTALRRFEGNRRQTARALGISERTLYRKLKEIED